MPVLRAGPPAPQGAARAARVPPLPGGLEAPARPRACRRRRGGRRCRAASGRCTTPCSTTRATSTTRTCGQGASGSGSISSASTADRRSEAVAERVERDFRSGIRAGVATTPTLFVDGQAFPGVPATFRNSCAFQNPRLRGFCPGQLPGVRCRGSSGAVARDVWRPCWWEHVRASAGELLRRTSRAASAADRSCSSGQADGRRRLRAADGDHAGRRAAVTAKLRRRVGRLGRRDLRGRQRPGRRRLRRRAARARSPSGFAVAGQRLVVQACRLSGSASSAGLSVQSTAIGTTQRADVAAWCACPRRPRRARTQLNELGLDVTEHGGAGFVEVVLHGAADAAKLRRQQLHLHGRGRRTSRAGAQATAPPTARFAARDRGLRRFPSGRTTYRRLFDYSDDMKRLARRAPRPGRADHAQPPDLRGPAVEGIEIATNPNARDGRPVFLQMGVHHAREWPSGEHAMEWAYELITGYRQGDARAQAAGGRPRARSWSRSSTRTASTPRARRASCTCAATGRRTTPTATGSHRPRVHPRGGRAPERVPAQELPPPGRRRRQLRAARHGHRRPGRRPEPQLRRVLGRPGRGASTNPLTQTYARHRARSRSPSRRTSASWCRAGR